MCKRYFVEVTGLGDDGIDRLVSAGVGRSSILMIDTGDKMQPLVDAIMKAAGVTFAEICSNSRYRDVMIARVIYVYHAMNAGETAVKVARDLNKDRTILAWYMNHYDESLQFDKQFRRIATAVSEILEADDRWVPTKVVATKGKAKRKKVRGKKRKRKAIEQVAVDVQKIIERRQMKIEFE